MSKDKKISPAVDLPKLSADNVIETATAYFNGDAMAADVWTNKYALRYAKEVKSKDGETSQEIVDDFTFGSKPSGEKTVEEHQIEKELREKFWYVESTPDDMHDRLANEIYEVESRYGKGYSREDFRMAFDKFRYIVPQGSPMYGIGNPFVKTSLSNCVVVPTPNDDMSGIFATGGELANLFKRRCGVGVSLDGLRPDGALVNNSAGTSTGAWSFADFYSFVCRMVGQNGRRGALMLTMNVLHPDIVKFITMKQDKTRVTGANVSVMLTNDFMRAVEKDEEWVCRWPIDAPVEEAKYTRRVQARKLWRMINEAATNSAEPGLLFWDNYCNNLPAHCYPEFFTICVNPCAEIGLSAFDSCRLTSLNLKNFVKNAFTKEAYFDFKEFEKMTRIAMHVMDNIVELEIEHLTVIMNHCTAPIEKELWKKLCDAARSGRRTGLGTHGLADALACLGLKYDGDEAIDFLDELYYKFKVFAYDESVELAKVRGAFPVFDWNLEKDCAFFKGERFPLWLLAKMEKYGRRNIALLTMAPTGTVSIVCQVSSGLEPVFSNAYMRKRKINPSDPNSRIDSTDQNGDNWTHYMVFHHNAQQWLEQHPQSMEQWKWVENNVPVERWEEELNKILPNFFITASQIDGPRRIEIQGHIQKHIDHGISSTINLPKGTSVEQVEALYMRAWEEELKGVTVYVDGSRTGVLTNLSAKANANDIQEAHCPKRPKELPCEIHHTKIKDEKWTILVGLLNGKPYEIFGGLTAEVEELKKQKSARVSKRKCGNRNCYDLHLEGNVVVEDIAYAFKNSEQAVQTRMLSSQLRHGIPVQFIVKQLGYDQDSSFYSFFKVVARVLKKYVNDGVKSGESCKECGEKVVFQEGCFVCMNCGASKCS